MTAFLWKFACCALNHVIMQICKWPHRLKVILSGQPFSPPWFNIYSSWHREFLHVCRLNNSCLISLMFFLVFCLFDIFVVKEWLLFYGNLLVVHSTTSLCKYANVLHIWNWSLFCIDYDTSKQYKLSQVGFLYISLDSYTVFFTNIFNSF